MPTRIPYLLVLNTALNASGTGTLMYTVPPNEKLEIQEIIFVSTGAFSLTDIRVSGGHVMTNAGSSNPIPSTLLRLATNEYNTLYKFCMSLTLDGGQQLYVDLVDTSAAPNTVRMLANSIRDV